MSAPSKRKFEKQRERQKKLAQKNNAAEQKAALVRQQRDYSETFPKFVFFPGDAPPRFVEVIREGVSKLNFENREHFGKSECTFFATLKSNPLEAQRFLYAIKETNHIGYVHLATMLGTLVFFLERERINQWIPFNDVRFGLDFHHGRILVEFESLREQKSKHGTIYFSRHRPQLDVDGEMKTVAWRKHAIERVCQRLVLDWQSYGGLGGAFAFLNRCMHFERSVLDPDQLAFTFFNDCAQGFPGHSFAEFVLGDECKSGDWFYRLGYCSADIEGEFIVARTALFPGHDNTPEYVQILNACRTREISRETAEQMKRELWGMDFQKQRSHESLGFIKWFHEHGVPQVVLGKPDWFADM